MKFIQTSKNSWDAIGGIHSEIIAKPRGQFLVIRNGKFYNASSFESAKSMCVHFDAEYSQNI
jgi:hypothetical protein